MVYAYLTYYTPNIATGMLERGRFVFFSTPPSIYFAYKEKKPDSFLILYSCVDYEFIEVFKDLCEYYEKKNILYIPIIILVCVFCASAEQCCLLKALKVPMCNVDRWNILCAYFSIKIYIKP